MNCDWLLRRVGFGKQPELETAVNEQAKASDEHRETARKATDDVIADFVRGVSRPLEKR